MKIDHGNFGTSYQRLCEQEKTMVFWSQIKTYLSVLHVGLVITLTFFFVGTVFTIIGLWSVFWMTNVSDDSRYDEELKLKVGLFRLCVTFWQDWLDNNECFGYANRPDWFQPDDSVLTAWRTFIIAGTVLAAGSFVACVSFIDVNVRGNNPTGIPFIATVISSISSVICLTAGLVAFGAFIHEPVYYMGYTFYLTCVAALLILIGCFVFSLIARRHLKSLRRPNDKTSLVKYEVALSTNPEIKTYLSVLLVGLVITLMFFASTVFTIIGLSSVYWMTNATYGDRSCNGYFTFKVGLFRLCTVCEDYTNHEECFTYAKDHEWFQPDDSGLTAWRIFIIAGTVLAAGSFVACVSFILVNVRGNNLTWIPSIATVISSISSFICLTGGLVAFGVFIHEQDYCMGDTFYLTCVAAFLILINCFFFFLTARRHLKSLRRANDKASLVKHEVALFTNPEKEEHCNQYIFNLGTPMPPGVQIDFGKPGLEEWF